MWCLDYVWCDCFFPSGFMTMICMGGVETRTKGVGHAGSSSPSQRSTRIFHCNSLGINTPKKSPSKPIQYRGTYLTPRGEECISFESRNRTFNWYRGQFDDGTCWDPPVYFCSSFDIYFSTRLSWVVFRHELTTPSPPNTSGLRAGAWVAVKNIYVFECIWLME